MPRPRSRQSRRSAWNGPTAATRILPRVAAPIPCHKGGPERGPGRLRYIRAVAFEIAERHTTKFNQTSAKAAPDLLTFVLYEMDPANDHSERAVRFGG